jgi:hypothetical protein
MHNDASTKNNILRLIPVRREPERRRLTMALRRLFRLEEDVPVICKIGVNGTTREVQVRDFLKRWHLRMQPGATIVIYAVKDWIFCVWYLRRATLLNVSNPL